MLISRINWGDDSAEKDPNLLEYFINSSSYQRLINRSKSIVTGRKGSGKSALRKKLEADIMADQSTIVVNIAPKYNSIRSILNNQDLAQNFGEEIFFQHVWLRQVYLDTLCMIGHLAKGKYAKDSLEFARKISIELNKTSKDVVENVSEVLSKIKVKAGSLGELGLHIEKELRNVADVDSLEYHVRQLLNDGIRIVVLFDDLDLGWDNSSTANNLLLGLLSAAAHLMSMSKSVYCYIFMREDVYLLIISKTQHSDKFRNIERIRWDKDSLIQVLENRINYNRRLNGYQELANPFASVFPRTIGTSNTDNWLIERTLCRPRELLQLARYYTESIDGDVPSDDVLKNCESDYSSWKLDDLCTEFSHQYPGLIHIFSEWKTRFFRKKYHLSRQEIEDMLIDIIAEAKVDELWIREIREDINVEALLKVLYEIGFIGDFVLGGQGGSKTFYSFDGLHQPTFREVQIHPCFRKAVRTVERIRQ